MRDRDVASQGLWDDRRRGSSPFAGGSPCRIQRPPRAAIARGQHSSASWVPPSFSNPIYKLTGMRPRNQAERLGNGESRSTCALGVCGGSGSGTRRRGAHAELGSLLLPAHRRAEMEVSARPGAIRGGALRQVRAVDGPARQLRLAIHWACRPARTTTQRLLYELDAFIARARHYGAESSFFDSRCCLPTLLESGAAQGVFRLGPTLTIARGRAMADGLGLRCGGPPRPRQRRGRADL